MVGNFLGKVIIYLFFTRTKFQILASRYESKVKPQTEWGTGMLQHLKPYLTILAI